MNKIAIAITALSFLISGISLYFSFQKNRLERRIISAQRKTEMLRHISNSRSKCERRLSKIRSMNK
ncbi:MAG: hypothetical protein NUV86_10850, partial [Candidatus Scalindua sp.]|nr:hypothetical protein [Candidatus Scalindua sp.]MCR4345436.1 hypothetical protein [Candidatus Scalindua sp.]